eukprot:2523584-Prymnesium_polylepis.1
MGVACERAASVVGGARDRGDARVGGCAVGCVCMGGGHSVGARPTSMTKSWNSSRSIVDTSLLDATPAAYARKIDLRRA